MPVLETNGLGGTDCLRLGIREGSVELRLGDGTTGLRPGPNDDNTGGKAGSVLDLERLCDMALVVDGILVVGVVILRSSCGRDGLLLLVPLSFETAEFKGPAA